MERILNNINESIIVCDLKGKILFGNVSIASKLKFSQEELKEMKIGEIAYQCDGNTKEIISNLLKDNNTYGEITLITKGKGKILFSARIEKELWQGIEAFYFIMDEIRAKGIPGKAYLEEILDAIPYNIFLKDIEGKYVYVNKKHAESVGMDRCELLFANDFDIWNKEDSKYFKGFDEQVLKYNKPIVNQHKVRGIEKKESWFETYKIPLINNKNGAKYVMGISRDITLSKKIEEQLERSHQDMMTLNNMITTSEYDAEMVFSSIKQDLINRLRADGGTIWIYDDKTTRLKPVVTFGISEDYVKVVQDIFIPHEEFKNPLNWGIEGVSHIEENNNIIIGKEKLNQLGIQYCGIYKITCNNEIIGLVHTLYKDKNDYNIKSDDFMKTMCNQLGMIIKNDLLSKDIKSEFSKRTKAEEELQTFLDTAVDLVAIVGADKKFKKVNSGWTEILGWTKEELYAMNSYDIVHPDDVILTKKIVDEIKEINFVKGIVNRYVSKTGEVYWIEWSSKYIPEKEISICTGCDITKLKKAEEQKETYEKALALEKVKSEFFSNISHEFKTPLNIILTTMQLIMKCTGDNGVVLTKDKLHKYMNSIRQNSYRLLRLVNNLIDITKIDTGYYDVNLENENIISVVEDITMSVAEYTAEKGIKLIFDTDEEELITACDPDKIERIMLNLLSNAIKYSKAEGIIKVAIKTKGDRVEVSVLDNGIGIEKEKLMLIFDRFSQVKNTLTRDCEGSGIGLSLVKSLVEMHGGRLWVESEFTKGSKFTFELPVVVIEEEELSIDSKDIISSKVEKCSIEFSDIYR